MCYILQKLEKMGEDISALSSRIHNIGKRWEDVSYDNLVKKVIALEDRVQQLEQPHSSTE